MLDVEKGQSSKLWTEKCFGVLVIATTQFHNTIKSSSGSSLSSLFYPKHTHSIRSKVNKLNTVFSLRGNQTGMSLNWNDKLTQAAIPWKRKRTPKPPAKNTEYKVVLYHYDQTQLVCVPLSSLSTPLKNYSSPGRNNSKSLQLQNSIYKTHTRIHMHDTNTYTLTTILKNGVHIIWKVRHQTRLRI